MVKVKNPLFSFTASGHFKKVIIFTSSKGTAIAKKFFKSKDTKSPVQLTRREIYIQGVNGWNYLPEGEKEEYEERAKAKALTGFNIFMREYLKSHNLPYSMGVYGLGIYDLDLYYPD